MRGKEKPTSILLPGPSLPLTPLRRTHSHTRAPSRPSAAAPLAPRRVTGTTSDATDEAVQANIVAQKYSLA